MIELVGTAQDYLDAVIEHWTDLGLDTSVPEALAVQAGVSLGTYRFAEYRQLSIAQVVMFEVRHDRGYQLLDVVVPDAEMPLWQVPLLSAETATIEAARGQIVAPTLNNVAILTPRTPRFIIGGYPKPPRDETTPDFPEPPKWEQRLPGVAPGYALGELVTREGVRYLQEGSAVQLPAGNYNVPGTVGSLWRAVAQGGGLDPWDQGALYQVGAEVAHAGNDWLNRRANNSFEPGTTQAGWLRINGRPYEWYHVGNEGYPASLAGEPMRVTRNGRLWRNPSDGNFWEPGVAIWIDEGPAP